MTDTRQRRLAVEDFSTTYLVEAAAGTGKTRLLVDRILAAVRAGTPMRELAAITFGEKAAAELKQRLRTLLEECSRKDTDQASLYAAALSDLEQTQVTTIHAFCAWMLREYPVEAGVDPIVEVADELESDLILEEAWEEWLPQQANELNPERSLLPRLLRVGAEVDKLWTLAQSLVEKRDALPEPPATPCRSTAEILPDLTERVASLSALRVYCATGDKLTSAIAEWERRAKQWQTLLPWEAEGLALTAPPLAPKKEGQPLGDERHWEPRDKFNQARELGKQIEQLRAELADRLTRDTLAWLRNFLACYERHKTARGRLDFHDLLRRARDLLRDNREVRGRLQRRFRYLFVDEFQDTNPMQVEIVFFLAERTPRAARWDECELATGKLFLVGDPKQSIYSFRGADIEIYQRVAELIRRQGGQVLNIRTSWRSRSTLLDWVNMMFRPLFVPPPDGRYQPDYVALEPLPNKRVALPSVWHLLPTSDEQAEIQKQHSADKSVARSYEAAAIARCLRHLHDKEKREWKEMAILFCAASAQETFLQALQNYAVPYRVLGGKDFYLRQEIQTLHSLLSCLDNPADTLHLVAVLRSPLFGWTDAQLYRAAQSRQLDYRCTPADPQAHATFALLRDLHARRHEGSVAAFVEKVFDATKICEAFLLCSADGAQNVANLHKALELARRLEMAGMGSLRGFLRRLRKDVREKHEEESSPTAEEGDDIVRVMTVHKSKGLDFPIVVMADLCGESSPRGAQLLWDRERNRLEAQYGNLRTAGFAESQSRQQRRDTAELIRMLYVAATRAKDLLILPWFIPQQPGRSALLAKEISAMPVALYQQHTSDAFAARPFSPRPLQIELTNENTGDLTAARQLWLDQRAALLARAHTPPRHRTPTSLAREPEKFTGTEGDASAARDMGALVHEVLERVDLRARPTEQRKQAKMWVEQSDLGPEAKRRAADLIACALNSDLLARARQAQQVEREMPFVLAEEEGLMEGKMDLLFCEKGKWVLVDYKTDAQADAAKYREQFRAYEQALQTLGIRPAEKILFFLSTNQKIPL